MSVAEDTGVRYVRGKPRFIDVAHPRAGDDWYCDPPEAIEALLDAERFPGWSWDPACGRGVIPGALRSRGLHCLATDLVDRGYSSGGADFFDPITADDARDRVEGAIDNVISNPPYKDALAWSRRALEVAEHKVALLLPLTFLEGQRRAQWLESSPLARVWIFPWRISMPPGELLTTGQVEPAGGKKAFAWFVWEIGWQGPAQVRFLKKPTAATPADRAAA